MAQPPVDNPSEQTKARLEALMACYEKLTWALPLNDIAPKLIAKRVMTIPDKQEIATKASDREKVAYFLDKCIVKHLKLGDKKNFDILMEVMKQNRKAAFLVAELEKELEAAVPAELEKELEAAVPPPAKPIENMRLMRMIVMPQLTPHWEKVATALQFTPTDIDIVKQEFNGDPKSCCVKILEAWISSDKGVKPSTWPVFLKSVTEAGLTGEADVIKEGLEKKNAL